MTHLPCRVLIIYDHGTQVEVLAQAIHDGARSINETEVALQRPRQTTKADLIAAHGIILGTPNWTGIKGTLKQWMDTTGDLWEEGTLSGKVGGAFTTSAGRHSGTEFTLLTLLHWMLGNGMIIVGLPWNATMESSGSYYGATAIGTVTEQDHQQAYMLGERVATVARRQMLAT